MGGDEHGLEETRDVRLSEAEASEGRSRKLTGKKVRLGLWRLPHLASLAVVYV
jgi:hypothetical protein